MEACSIKLNALSSKIGQVTWKQELTISGNRRNAYNMVINKFGDHLYNGLHATLKKHLEGIAEKISATQGELFLRELKQRWDHHNKSMQMIRDILMVSSSLRYPDLLYCMPLH